MKKFILSTIMGTLLFLTGCQNLDLNPLSEASTENWYTNEQEIKMAVNDLYRASLWYWEANRLFHSDRFTDDWSQRDHLYEWIGGTVTSETSYVETTWLNSYKGISRANTIIGSLEHANLANELITKYEGETRFFRAVFYSYLIFLYGDVPFFTDYLSLEEAYEMKQTDKNTILKQIYEDFDKAIEYLPVTNIDTESHLRVTKGAAYAFKARTAIWFSDWATCRDAAKSCMDLDIYSLHPDFDELFVTDTRKSDELIFTIPRSTALNGDAETISTMYPRNPGGSASAQPSWELLCSFTCTDGKPIDESPLYNPAQPFKNRDPRCAATIVEFGTEHLGFIYDPSPAAKQVLNLTTGKMVTNKDSKINDQWAAFNGLALKKGACAEWTEDKQTDRSYKIMRYADVLLMYAEAKMELNEIDASTLNAINQVRARAYKCEVTETTKYPAVTETNQAKLRTILRYERRSELAWENKRWFDIIRWRQIETALQRPLYVMLQDKNKLLENYDNGDWFFPKDVLPDVMDDGTIDFSAMYATGKIQIIFPRSVPARQYLLPIPLKELAINPNLVQNPGY